MNQGTLHREVVGMFYKDRSKRVRLNSLVVLQEHGKNDGHVYLVKEYWDVDWSRKFGYLFHMSGCGGDETIEVRGIYHATAKSVAMKLLGQSLGALVAPRIVEKEQQWVEKHERNRTRRLTKLPNAIVLDEDEDLMDWLQYNGIESDMVWCSSCRDCFPGSNDYDLCEHVWWCENTATYSTPDDRCKCKNLDECLVRY